MSKVSEVITRMEILGVPPSVNAMYMQTRTGRRFKSDEYKTFETLAKFMKVTGPELRGAIPYECEILYFSNWFCKDGSLRRVDVDNRGKAVLDVLSMIYPEFDDSQIVDLRLRKLNWENQCKKTILKFTPLGRLSGST